MGRKRKGAKAEGEANANENFNPPVESTENVQTTPSRLPSRQKGSKQVNEVIRRSGRLRSLHKPASNKEMIVEEIDLVASEQEEEPLVEQFNSEPPPTDLQRLESKIDFLVRSVQEFKSEGATRTSPTETPVELRYRSLYIESQKKIEELTKENLELVKNLEFAKGKVEAFEQINVALRNLKDMGHMALMTNLGRATEAIVNLSSQPAARRFDVPEEANIHGAAAAENNITSPDTRKKYARRKK